MAAEERGAAHGCCKLNVRGASDPPAQLIREFVSWFQILDVLSKFLMHQEFENQILDAEPNLDVPWAATRLERNMRGTPVSPAQLVHEFVVWFQILDAILKFLIPCPNS